MANIIMYLIGINVSITIGILAAALILGVWKAIDTVLRGQIEGGEMKYIIVLIIGAVFMWSILTGFHLIHVIGSVDNNGDVVCPYNAKECIVPFSSAWGYSLHGSSVIKEGR